MWRAWAGAGALLVASALPVPAAHATGSSAELVADTPRPLALGRTNQVGAAFSLRLSDPADRWEAGELILITIDDVNGSTCGTNDAVAFGAVPALVADGSAAVRVTTRGSSNACSASAIEDVLQIEVVDSGAGVISLGPVAITSFAAATPGPIAVTVTSTAREIVAADPSPGALSPVGIEAAPPLQGGEEGGAPLDLGGVVINEHAVDALDDRAVCITLTGGATVEPSSAPAIASGGPDPAVSVGRVSDTSVRLAVGSSDPPATSSFTITGVRAGADRGRVAAVLTYDGGETCAPGDALATLSPPVALGAVANVARLAGSDRFATAARLMQDAFVCPSSAVLARGDDFPDALSGAYLAGTLGTGVLLAERHSVPITTLDALRLEGVKTVYVIGGESAISTQVETQLRDTPQHNCGGFPVSGSPGLRVVRIGGDDRFETARRVAEYPGFIAAGTADVNGPEGNPAGPAADARRTAIIVSGTGFADAVTAGPVAWAGTNAAGDGKSLPLLLVTQDDVPAATEAALTNLATSQVFVLGGPAVVSSSVVGRLNGMGMVVRRFAGADRTDTAAEFADFAVRSLGYDDDDVLLARGDTFPDALAASAYAGRGGAGLGAPDPLVLAAAPGDPGAATLEFLATPRRATGAAAAGRVDDVAVVGGIAAVDPATVDLVVDAIATAWITTAT